MSDERLHDWLEAAGLESADALPPLASGDLDDPWGDATIAPVRLSDEQRSYLVAGLDDDPLDADELARADAEIIDIPTDIDDIEPFDA